MGLDAMSLTLPTVVQLVVSFNSGLQWGISQEYFNGRNLQQMTRVTCGICLHKNSEPRGLSAPALGLYTCIKTGKSMYKIILQGYFFETCNKWAKWQGLSVDIRLLVHKGLSAPAPGLYTCGKCGKNIKKCV